MKRNYQVIKPANQYSEGIAKANLICKGNCPLFAILKIHQGMSEKRKGMRENTKMLPIYYLVVLRSKIIVFPLIALRFKTLLGQRSSFNKFI